MDMLAASLTFDSRRMAIDCTAAQEKYAPHDMSDIQWDQHSQDGMILCWDVRNLGELLCTYHRQVKTNQRIYFDFDP